jgi:hypothetical protein
MKHHNHPFVPEYAARYVVVLDFFASLRIMRIRGDIMQRLGFIHDMLDVKVLILFVMARVNYPVTSNEVYELCYQDDCLSYFDVCTAIPEMVKSGHLKELEDQKYEITEKGRADGSLTEDSIAFTVKQRAENAVAKYNRQIRRSSFVKTQVIPRDGSDYSVIMALDDEMGNLMTLELVAPDQRQAVRLGKLFEKKAEMVYNLTMAELLDEEDDLES